MLEMSTSPELSDWLRDLSADTKGSVEEKRQRVRQQTTLFAAPTNEVIDQVVGDLRKSDAGWSEELCKRLGLATEGSKGALIRRVHRYVSMREGQLPWITPRAQPPTLQEVYPVVAWYPIYQSKAYEKDYYRDFFEAMTEVFGDHHVHEQMPVSHGNSLKIDFHIGSAVPGSDGVGVEFKMPANNSDVQKALGQMGQYQSRYRDSLMVVVFPDLLDNKHLIPFQHELTRMNIAHVVKRQWSDQRT